MNRFDILRKKAVPILKPYARRITVFGSYARGDDTAKSDIDILIALKPAEKRPPLGLKFFRIQEELSQTLGRPIDLATEDDLSPYIQKNIISDKVVIYEEG
jgi:uncharacterized protein